MFADGQFIVNGIKTKITVCNLLEITGADVIEAVGANVNLQFGKTQNQLSDEGLNFIFKMVGDGNGMLSDLLVNDWLFRHGYNGIAADEVR